MERVLLPGMVRGVIALVVPGFGCGRGAALERLCRSRLCLCRAVGAGQIATHRCRARATWWRSATCCSRWATASSRRCSTAPRRGSRWREANLANLTTGSREDEIDVIRATLSKAKPTSSLARDSAARAGKLFAEGIVPQAQLDQDRASLASAEAAVRQLQAQLKVAELPARDAQRLAAEANLAMAARPRPKRRAPTSPTAPCWRRRRGGSSGCSSTRARSRRPVHRWCRSFPRGRSR